MGHRPTKARASHPGRDLPISRRGSLAPAGPGQQHLSLGLRFSEVRLQAGLRTLCDSVIFHPTRLAGVFEIEVSRHADDRGFFARTWCKEEFEEACLSPDLVQCSISFNRERGTLRGMHYQASPFAEDKLVRCTTGAIYDVALDLRLNSPTFRQWFGVVLSAENHRSLYVPKGCAHGFLTLSDGSEVFYQMSAGYCPDAARGVRWNDPAFRIEWPVEVRVISERDRDLPDYV
jgi:dTDP-4-dehydrorhamnose 3,5-epimerase